MSLGIWMRAVRAPFFTATIVPVLLGTAVAYNVGLFNLINFILVLVAAVLIHAGINLSNDYFDHKSGNDEANKTPTPFSGGSRVIQNGLIQPNKILYASLFSILAGSAIGMYLFSVLGMTIIYLGITGILIGVFYTAPPLKLGYRGIGELLVGLGFGIMMVMGAYFVQASAFALPALLASVPVAILISLVLFINEFPDYETDKSTKKNTLVVLLGKKTSVKLYQLLLIAAYTWVPLMVFLGYFPIYTIITFLTIPLALTAIKISGQNYDKINELLPANASTIKIHLSFGLLLALGFVLATLL